MGSPACKGTGGADEGGHPARSLRRGAGAEEGDKGCPARSSPWETLEKPPCDSAGIRSTTRLGSGAQVMKRPDTEWQPWPLRPPTLSVQPRPGQGSGHLPRIALCSKPPGGILAVGLGSPQLGLLTCPEGHSTCRQGEGGSVRGPHSTRPAPQRRQASPTDPGPGASPPGEALLSLNLTSVLITKFPSWPETHSRLISCCFKPVRRPQMLGIHGRESQSLPRDEEGWSPRKGDPQSQRWLETVFHVHLLDLNGPWVT